MTATTAHIKEAHDIAKTVYGVVSNVIASGGLGNLTITNIELFNHTVYSDTSDHC
ncbi:MAG: hypothetical protein WBE34_18490 [Candidatus Nitrosopolaris sp.]